MENVIFNLRNDKQKYEDTVQHINWLIKQYDENKR